MWKTPGSPDKGLLHPSFCCPSLRRRDGVTELTSWITSNTLLEAGQPNLPPPRSLSITLCLSLALWLPLQGVYLSIFPSRHMHKQSHVQLVPLCEHKSPYGLSLPLMREYRSVSTAVSGKTLTHYDIIVNWMRPARLYKCPTKTRVKNTPENMSLIGRKVLQNH